jgi:hypothetical protein
MGCEHRLHDGTLFCNVTLFVVNPTDGHQVRVRVADLESRLSELIDEVDDTVFEINLGQAQNERRNGIEQRAGTVWHVALDPYAMVNRIQNLVVGTKTGGILGLPPLVQVLDI